MTYHVVCGNDPCVCPSGEVQELTVKIDEDTWKTIEQEAGGGSIEDQAARILTEHDRRRSEGATKQRYQIRHRNRAALRGYLWPQGGG